MKYDVLVLGSGPAGFYSALTCARGGLKTALVEKAILGGTGFATGCLPVKLILDKIDTLNRASEMLSGNISEDEIRKIHQQILKGMKNHSESVSRLEKERLEDAGVNLFQSQGEFKDSSNYVIDSGEIAADKIIIATGTEPAFLPGTGLSQNVISHKEAVCLETIPDEILIVGGDVEGIEFASLFSQLGASVTVLEQLPEIMPGYDRDLIEPLLRELKDKKVDLHCSVKVENIIDHSSHVIVSTDKESYKSNKVLVTGLRKAAFPGGLKKIGIKVKEKSIIVDQNYETNIRGIYAIGDINGILGMAGTAIQQAVQLTDYLIKGYEIRQDYSILPRAVFTVPGICGGGVQEKDISDSDSEYSVKKFSIDRNWRAFSSNQKHNFVKVIVDKDEIIRGIWFVLERADSHGGAIGFILKQQISIDELRRDLYVHPTIFESLFEAGIQ